LKQLFLQYLPNNAQLILTSTSEAGTIEQLAEIVKKIVEEAAPTTSIAAGTCQPLGATSDFFGHQDLLSTSTSSLLTAHGTILDSVSVAPEKVKFVDILDSDSASNLEVIGSLVLKTCTASLVLPLCSFHPIISPILDHLPSA